MPTRYVELEVIGESLRISVPLAAEISIARRISRDKARELMVGAALPEHAQAA